MLCLLWECEPMGEFIGNRTELVRLLRCSRSELNVFLRELSANKFGDFDENGKQLTIKCRRLCRLRDQKTDWRERQKKHRHGIVINQSRNNHAVSSTSTSSSTTNKEYMSIFDEARKLFKGTKRGLKTEYDNFIKKHTDWREVLKFLTPAVSQQIEWRAEDGRYWKHFKTWINNRCWEETKGVSQTESKSKPKLFPISGKVCSVKGCRMPAVYLDASGNYDSYKCNEHLPLKVKESYE